MKLFLPELRKSPGNKIFALYIFFFNFEQICQTKLISYAKFFVNWRKISSIVGYNTNELTQLLSSKIVELKSLNRGSYMSAHVLLNLLNELGKI